MSRSHIQVFTASILQILRGLEASFKLTQLLDVGLFCKVIIKIITILGGFQSQLCREVTRIGRRAKSC